MYQTTENQQAEETVDATEPIITGNASNLQRLSSREVAGSVAQQQAIANALFKHQKEVLASGKNFSVIFTPGDLTLDPAVLANNSFAIYAGGTVNFQPSIASPSKNPPMLQPAQQHSPHCHICKAKFPSEAELYNHTYENNQGCQDCAMCFRSKKDLDEHNRTAHEYCVWCQCNLGILVDLEKHNTDSHPRCTWCNTTPFRSDDELYKHNCDNHIWCEFCEKFFKSETSRDQHNVKSHSWCDPCQTWFKSKETLKSHFRKTHSTCSICSTVCESLDQKTRHTSWYHPKCQFQGCPSAVATFRTRELWEQHKELEHPKCWICPHLGRYPSQTALLGHQTRRHHICIMGGHFPCNKAYRTAEELTGHKQRRHREPVYGYRQH